MNLKKITKLSFYTLLLLLTIIYIIYRIFFTIPTTLGVLATIAAILVLLIEIWESFDFFIYYLNILLVDKTSPKTPDVKILDYPDIDILIATYNEPENLLKNTITACQNMNYPDKNKLHIYLCDDGNRPTIKKLASQMNINYISRLVNKNAKAGNYNHALNRISSPFVATFDADMAPTPLFLQKSLPYFFEEKEKIGFIQMPQSFINPDIYQSRFGLSNTIPFEQDYFYHTLQIAKNKTNSAVYCGTNTLFSREALNAVGGFATGTLSEDIATRNVN